VLQLRSGKAAYACQPCSTECTSLHLGRLDTGVRAPLPGCRAGAGFYLDATVPKWARYRMDSYITRELMGLLKANAPSLDLARMSICGHSMGGHGALTIGLKNAAMFKSISAFAPICNPMKCPWGEKGACTRASACARVLCCWHAS
jgi:S-formylglutathione hydrolase FrmB